jgi:hypothetical protein
MVEKLLVNQKGIIRPYLFDWLLGWVGDWLLVCFLD